MEPESMAGFCFGLQSRRFLALKIVENSVHQSDIKREQFELSLDGVSNHDS
jgi:hypothetical protein